MQFLSFHLSSGHKYLFANYFAKCAFILLAQVMLSTHLKSMIGGRAKKCNEGQSYSIYMHILCNNWHKEVVLCTKLVNVRLYNPHQYYTLSEEIAQSTVYHHLRQMSVDLQFTIMHKVIGVT